MPSSESNGWIYIRPWSFHINHVRLDSVKPDRYAERLEPLIPGNHDAKQSMFKSPDVLDMRLYELLHAWSQ